MRLVALLVLACAAVVPAQVVDEVQWGFDGRVVSQRFNLLRVRVDNPSTVPFSGELRLWRTEEFGLSRLGARIVEPCFVAPGSSRWVTLYPFIVDERARWTVQVGRARVVLDAPAFGPPASVFLADAAAPTMGEPAMARFPSAGFPPTVLGTAGLAAVVLAEVPDWDGPRREAFRRWVYRGGRVHLLPGGGRHPRFGGDLSMLDGADARQRYGAGWVIREARAAGDLDPASTARPAAPLPFSAPGAVHAVLRALRVAVTPDHDWGLILLCAVLYLVVVGPVHWFLAARRLSTVAALAVLVALVGGFGLVFHLLGRRGYDERALTQTLAYARAVEPGVLEVLQFTDVFVTSGDRYRIRAGADDGLFTTAQRYEAVPGVIRNGKGGAFDVDIPIYSHREVVHAAAVPGALPKVELGAWPERPVQLGFELAHGGDVRAAVAVWNGEGHVLRVSGGRLVPTGERLSPSSSNPFAVAPGEGLDPAVLLPLAVPAEVPVRTDEIDLLLLAPSPPSLALRGTGADEQRSFVVYHLRFERDEHR